MAFTQADIDTLDRAIASGTLKVKYDWGEVEYRSLEDLQQARRMISAELNQGTSLEHTYPRHQLADFNDE